MTPETSYIEHLHAKVDEMRARDAATRGGINHLIGKYGDRAARTGNEDLAALVRELSAVRDGTDIPGGNL